MARIASTRIPDDKKAKVALTYIFGIGPTRASQLLDRLNLDPEKRIKDFTEQEISRLRDEIEKSYQVEGALRTQLTMNIKRLKETNSYRGMRHRVGLPAHGQRTKTNARTRKGKKRSAGSGKRPITKK